MEDVSVFQSEDLSEILKVELKRDNMQSFNARWGGTIVAMKKQPDEELQCAVHCRQLRRSEQLGPLPSLYIQDTSQKGESRDHTGLENMGVQYLEQKTLEKHVSKGKPPTCFVFKWVIVQKGIPVIAGIHLSVLFSSTR